MQSICSHDGILKAVSSDRPTFMAINWEPTRHLKSNQERNLSCIYLNSYLGSHRTGWIAENPKLCFVDCRRSGSSVL